MRGKGRGKIFGRHFLWENKEDNLSGQTYWGTILRIMGEKLGGGKKWGKVNDQY